MGVKVYDIKGIIFGLWLFSFMVLDAKEPIEIGCPSVVSSKTQECSSLNPLTASSSLLNDNEHNASTSPLVVNITEKLASVTVMHQNHELVIERVGKDHARTCPPFCIQPLSIDGVQTVGELETLTFIEALKEKKGQLLIDARSSDLYNKSTIPGAINLPYTMLSNKSKYQKEVLTLLGAKQAGTRWYFKNIKTLLIFGDGAEDIQASQAIQTLVKLGYPKENLLYYRGGVESWKSLGLTLY